MITPNIEQYLKHESAPKLAQAYIPIQMYRNLFNVNEALYHGTIFRELFQPYKPPHPLKF
jgi:hypothetical protein